jgi:hypothetical protein
MARYMLALACSGAAMTLAACASEVGTSDDDGPTSYTYTCDDGRSFFVIFSEDDEKAFVSTDDDTYELIWVDTDEFDESDDGEYQNDHGVELTFDQEEDAYLAIPEGDDFENCE